MSIPTPNKLQLRLGALLVVLAGLAPTESARAGGFFLFDRGAVGVSRGGAFIAGADDADAVYYNPAGLVSAGRQLHADIGLPRLNASFTRVDDFGTTMPRVDGSQQFLPTPSISFATPVRDRWSIGVGVYTPSAIVQRWPDMAPNGTDPAPQRYSLYNIDNTILASAAAGVAYDAGHGLSFGLSLGVNIADFNLVSAVSGCDGGLLCAFAEDPANDSRTTLKSGVMVSPLATLGVRYRGERWGVGASFSTPYRFRGNFDMISSVPEAFQPGQFQTADGSSPTVRGDMRFAWVLRTGVEVRPVDHLRAEFAYVVEGWNVQQDITFTPQGVSVSVLGGLVTLPIVPIVVPRQMMPTHSFRLGGQYEFDHFDVRAGVAYETRSFPDRTLSPRTLDNNKTIVSAGATAHIGERFMIDLTFAYAFIRDPNITNSIVTQNRAVAPRSNTQPPTVVANGQYQMDAWYLAAGLRYQFSPKR